MGRRIIGFVATVPGPHGYRCESCSLPPEGKWLELYSDRAGLYRRESCDECGKMIGWGRG